MTTEGFDPDKLRLLTGLLADRGLRRRPTLAPSYSDQPTPLSTGQQRLWLLEQIEGPSAAYNIAALATITGDLDVARLERAASAVVRRHAALRTQIAAEGGRAVQTVRPARDLALDVVDLAHHPAAERQLADDVAALAALPFVLEGGDLFRLRLHRLGARDHRLCMVVHHIVADGWSLEILIRDLLAAYGADTSLPGSDITPLDFAVWEHAALNRGDFEDDLGYWEEQLAGAPQVVALPTDRPRVGARGSDGARIPWAPPARVVQDLGRLAAEEGATTFMALAAALSALLQRYSGQADLIVGSPVAGREDEALDGVVGCFANLLPLRVAVDPKASFRCLLRQVRTTTLGALAHQTVPFDAVVERVRPERGSPGDIPLINVVLALHRTQRRMALGPARLELAEVASGTARFELNLQLEETPEGISGYAEFLTRLFDHGTVERLLGHLQHLLEQVVHAPDEAIGGLSLAGEAELAAAVAAHSTEPLALPEPETLGAGFAAAVERAPEAVAVTAGGHDLSYRALDRRAAALAQELSERGAAPETLVTVCLPPSLDLLVSILAVVKSGAAYLPMDPDHPPARRAAILRESGATLLVTSDGIAATEAHAETPSSPATADTLAYVIFTSGSTGVPKGVQVSHRNVCRLISAVHQRLSFGPGDTWTMCHSAAFDMSVFEMWAAWLHGGRLVVIGEEDRRSPDRLIEILTTERVTILNHTPTGLRQLVTEDERRGGVDLCLRYILLGGEALDPQRLSQWFARHGDTAPTLVNLYGITETTVHSTCRPIAAADSAQRASLIGTGLPGVQVRVLDAHLGVVPSGVVGEICVGGSGVARGYLGQPGLTASRFVPDPHGDSPGARLYRSGDLGRWLSDGDIEYLGRADQQVQIRGFRVELDDVAAALERSPHVALAAALLVDVGQLDPELVGYVVPAAGEREFDARELRRHVRSELPEAMVPRHFVVLDELPVTRNGKLDRGALPAPDRRSPAGYAAPQTATQRQLAGIWSQCLGRERIGLHERFFDVGGQSLFAVQVSHLVCEAFGVDLPVRALLESPTIEELADVVERLHPAGGAGRAAPVPALLRSRGRQQASTELLEQLRAEGVIPGGTP